MAITITPNIQPSTASAPSAPASGIVLQAGQVITAQVLQVLGNDQVQIAIGNQTIEAATQVPLQAGQTLQLQVSQTPGGIGLSIVNQPSTGPSQSASAPAATSDPVLTLSPSLAASLAANLTPVAVSPTSSLTPLETLAVSIAAQTAATQQTSLAPLFADLNVASGLPNLPPQVQQAAVQVLAQQTSFDQNLTAGAVKQAFQSSGLFLETLLASGSAPLSNGVPDLKAALIVLRQVLTTSLADVTTSASVAAPALSSASQPGAPPAATPVEETTPSAATPSDPAATGSVSARAPASVAQQGTTPALAASVPAEQAAVESSAVVATILAEAESPGQVSEGRVGATSLVPATATAAASTQTVAQATLAEIAELVAGNQSLAAAAVPADAARTAASSVALSLLQEVLQASPLAVTNPSQFVSENSQALALLPVVAGARTPDDAEFARTNLPPPPINGALPSAQPVASSTLSAHMPPNTALQHLLDGTDGAIARQTLLQIASLPGQVDASASRVDASAPRWNFEIPFATPQGTAMAQFEISRDGSGREAAAAKATWRARFSLNVEPAGPVHALVSLNGDRTSVRMWAERPSTASQLRAGVSQLSQALSRAELKPGDIVIRDGAPSQPAAAAAGHFLDRAS
ncbi:MAG: flagellar hook-length control protein FliK [Bradyrhizobium sp.]